jgi:uncharacterized protein YlxW (UPF0749 family)
MSAVAGENRIEAQAPAAEAAEPRRPAWENWVWQVTALSAALGLMLALAIRTTNRIHALGLPSNRHGVSAAILTRYQEQNSKLQQETAALRKQVEEFRRNQATGQSSSELLQTRLTEYRALLGFAPVQGPGLRIRLQHSTLERLPGTDESDYQVIDQDLTGIVNELWAAGAEAVAVAGSDGQEFERFTLRTTVRTVGASVEVNGRVLSAPYTVLAVGNSKDLRAALEMPEGIVKTRGLDVLKMIVVEEAPKVVLPAFRGPGASRQPAAPNQ